DLPPCSSVAEHALDLLDVRAIRTGGRFADEAFQIGARFRGAAGVLQFGGEVEQRVEVLWRELDGASPVRERLVLTPRPRRDHAEAVLRPRRPWIERRRF